MPFGLGRFDAEAEIHADVILGNPWLQVFAAIRNSGFSVEPFEPQGGVDRFDHCSLINSPTEGYARRASLTPRYDIAP
jgi:hypothetical protein